ncbi:MAG: leucyl aminopeptidase family protein [Nitratireductor sp.]|nr:leucyl aminopeptidase family protein [Nitratireductor sp.]
MPSAATPFLAAAKDRQAIPVLGLTPETAADTLKSLSPRQQAWAQSHGFEAKAGTLLTLPGEDGKIGVVLFAMAPDGNPLAAGKLAHGLPKGLYRLEGDWGDSRLAALGIALGAYRFDRYRSQPEAGARFLVPEGVDRGEIESLAAATFLVRDLVNTPTNDLGPDALEKAVRKLAAAHKAKVRTIAGDALLKQNFPMIHAVGRASAIAPRLIELRWGRKSDPKVTLVGKGVCFDTGGLNLKPGTSMALMKKDMGGAANVLGLARLIMGAGLKVNLRVLIPAVENSVAGNAFRPGDILPSRKGISVEIGNTDAEGRLILGDALAYGDEEKPDLMIDMATLTGAARVALGPDLPPFYSDDEDLAAGLAAASRAEGDPLWRMPLWQPYDAMLASKIADTNHITSGGFAGSVTAALFLKKFIGPATPWIHLDIFAWVPNAKPWCPVGGEAQGIRALFKLIGSRYPA